MSHIDDLAPFALNVGFCILATLLSEPTWARIKPHLDVWAPANPSFRQQFYNQLNRCFLYFADVSQGLATFIAPILALSFGVSNYKLIRAGYGLAVATGGAVALRVALKDPTRYSERLEGRLATFTYGSRACILINALLAILVMVYDYVIR